MRGQEPIRGLKGRNFEEETPDARNFILRRFGECSLNISSIEPQNASPFLLERAIIQTNICIQCMSRYPFVQLRPSGDSEIARTSRGFNMILSTNWKKSTAQIMFYGYPNH